MKYSNIKIGDKCPKEFNSIVEISMNSGPVKYEFNKEMDAIFVDRFMESTMEYPCNYGFVPHTLSGDGDPLDILIHTNHAILVNSIIMVRPIGVLYTEGEKGLDEKILSVPIDKIDSYFQNIKNYSDLPTIFLKRIEHFFARYKDLNNNKWVKVNGWGDTNDAEKIITMSVDNYKNKG